MTGVESTSEWQASIGNSMREQSPLDKAPLKIRSDHKRVLLVDVHHRTRDSRAEIMRKMGVTVDCAANADSARARLATRQYNLILLDLGADTVTAEGLAREIRSGNSRQLVGFLVGRPLFVARHLSGNTVGPRRVPPVTNPNMPEQKVSTPAEGASDFGRRIKEAEREVA